MNMHVWKYPALWFSLTATTIVFATSSAFATAPGKASGHGLKIPDICLDSLFYAPLPGKTNYCLGLRDWKKGHYHTALEFFRLAAGWGNKNAQYTLGLIYYGGRHVAPNPALGIAWLELANQRNNDVRIGEVTQAALKWSTPAQRDQAKTLYQRMLPTFGDKVAAARAWHHLRHWERSNDNASGQLCLYGAQRWVAMQLLHGSTGGDQCAGISLQAQTQLVQASASRYFSGFIGVVTVGPLQTVPAPAASSGK
ncbi:MAG TPA: hypothetical protein VF269_00465 [Rhodanobacteraceae bacterium]